MSNPLQKYFRQPKLFIQLPSKGLFYEEGVLTGDHNNFPVFAMTGMDEIIMKTPDALFSGEATVRLIESCCPYITDGRKVPSLDIDTILVAIRIATSGNTLSITSKCKNCNEENEFDINLASVMEHYTDRAFNNILQIDDLSVILRPINYSEMSYFNIENFKLQKMLRQLITGEAMSDEQRQSHIDSIYKKISENQVDLFLHSIESVRTPTEIVTNKEFISEWLKSTDKTIYNQIKQRLEENTAEWAMPKHAVKCASCGTEDVVDVSMDQSSFFD